MAHFIKYLFQKKNITLKFSCTSWSLSLWKISKESLEWIQSYDDVPLSGQNDPFAPNENFFRKAINISFMYLLAPFTLQNFKNGFIMAGDGKFLKSLYNWQRNFMKTLLLPTPLFSNFVHIPSPPLSCHLQPPPQMFFLLPCFFGWMGDHATFDVLLCLGTLVPWDVFYTKRRQIYGGLTHYVVFYWYSDLISNTHTHKAHSEASRLIHPYKCMVNNLVISVYSYTNS